ALMSRAREARVYGRAGRPLQPAQRLATPSLPGDTVRILPQIDPNSPGSAYPPFPLTETRSDPPGPSFVRIYDRLPFPAERIAVIDDRTVRRLNIRSQPRDWLDGTNLAVIG